MATVHGNARLARHVADIDDSGHHTGGAGGSLPWFVVTDVAYGAANDGTTDDTTAIDAAIAALNAAGAGVLYFPGGTGYKVTAALTSITVPCLVLGDGGARAHPTTLITQTSSTAHTFTQAAHGVTFRGIAGARSGTTSSNGSFIHVTSGDRSRYEDVSAVGFYINFDVEDGAEWSMTACQWSDGILYNARLRHTDAVDSGDWTIEETFFGSDNGADAHIRYESGGGGKLLGCKFNGVTTQPVLGIDVVFASVKSVVLVIAGCSLENMSSHAIKVTTTGTGAFGFISITGTQFGMYSNNSGRAVYISAATNGVIGANGAIAGVVIDGCVMHTGGTARAAIELVNTDRVTLGDIQISGFNARYTSSGDTNTTDGSSISYATPAIVLGSSAAGGAASTVIRSDATIAAFDGTVPVTQAFSDSAATGSAAFAARRDHKHGMPASPTVTAGILLIADTHSTPLVFADLLQTEAQDDLLYGD